MSHGFRYRNDGWIICDNATVNITTKDRKECWGCTGSHCCIPNLQKHINNESRENTTFKQDLLLVANQALLILLNEAYSKILPDATLPIVPIS